MLWKEITIENYNLSNQYLGDFTLTPYLTKIFNENIQKCFEALAFNTQELIDAYLNYALTNFPFDTLLPIQKQLLIKAVFYQINHILYNVLPIERTEDQSVSIPNSVSINLQLKQFIFSPDALSTRTKELCEATGLRHITLDKEKYIESRISELPNIFNTYTIKDLQNLNCNYYYFLPIEKGAPKLSLINYKLDNAISGFLQKLDDYSYKLICLYYADLKNKIENIVESILYINFDKKPINIGDDGAKWITNTNINKYIGDGETIEIDNQNIVSSMGVKDKTSNKVASAKVILDTIQKSTDNKTNIDHINTEINNIGLNLEKKVDKNNLKEELISTDPQNDLIIGSDNKLFVKDNGGGGGDKYYADEKTTHLDSKNTFSAIGISTGDTQFPVVSGKDIVQFRDAIVEDKEQIKDLTQDVETNTKNIQTNKDGVANNKKLIDENTGSIKNLDDVVNNKCVKNDALDEIVVDAKTKPDNILQVLNGNKLYVPIINLKWKLFATTKDFHFTKSSASFDTRNFKEGDWFMIYLGFSMPNTALNLIGNTLMSDKTVSSAVDIAFVYDTNKLGSINVSLSLFDGNIYISSYQIDDFTVSIKTIYIWKIENAFEIPPSHSIKPKPILTKRNIFNANKTIFCMEDFND